MIQIPDLQDLTPSHLTPVCFHFQIYRKDLLIPTMKWFGFWFWFCFDFEKQEEN